MFLAISLLVLELFSIFGIFFAFTRLTIFILACLFHLGILVLLGPNYVSRCICYLMIIDIPMSSKSYILTTSISSFDIFIKSFGAIIIIGYLGSLIITYEG